jgi:hypothetical protein
MTAATRDETRPLLPERIDRDVVDYELDFKEGDAENPLEWSTSFKWGMVMLLAFMAFTV